MPGRAEAGETVRLLGLQKKTRAPSSGFEKRHKSATASKNATHPRQNSPPGCPRSGQRPADPALDAGHPGQPTQLQGQRAPLAVPGGPGAQGRRRAAGEAAHPQSGGRGHDDDADARGRVRAGRPQPAEPVAAGFDNREHPRRARRRPPPQTIALVRNRVDGVETKRRDADWR